MGVGAVHAEDAVDLAAVEAHVEYHSSVGSRGVLHAPSDDVEAAALRLAQTQMGTGRGGREWSACVADAPSHANTICSQAPACHGWSDCGGTNGILRRLAAARVDAKGDGTGVRASFAGLAQRLAAHKAAGSAAVKGLALAEEDS